MSVSQPFQNASNLIASICQKTESIPNLTIFAGCYPDQHPECRSPQDDMIFLRQKADAGVDFLITQIFYSSQTFLEFVERCLSHQIKVPIIPGIYIPASFRELMKITKITKVKVPQKLFESYKVLELDQEAFEEFSLTNSIKMIQDMKLNSKEHIKGFHFFTFNSFCLLKRIITKIDVSE